MAKSTMLEGAKTHSGFFPPSPSRVIERVVVKENIQSPRTPVSPRSRQVLVQSPGRTVTVVRNMAHENSPRQIPVQTAVPLNSDREILLDRKVKVLEGRVAELHN